MERFKWLTIRFALEEEEAPKRTISPTVDLLWEKELEKRALFDGKLFSVSKVLGKTVYGYFVPYRQWIAQVQNPSLKKELQIVSAGLSGLIRQNGKILAGKRSQQVTLYKGAVDLAPSGTVDRLDLRELLEDELKEETGLQGLQNVVQVGALYDRESDHVEFVIRADLEGEPKPNLAEYEWLKWFTSAELLAREDLTPICRFMIESQSKNAL